MCGRYDLNDVREIVRHFQLGFPAAVLQPRYNVAPGQRMPVVVRHSPNQVEMMTWGFIPSWSKDGKGFINARSETVSIKPAFRDALRHARCLVPACGFFEWQRTERGKAPYRIWLKDSPLFAFAGIYSIWTSPLGNATATFAILTTDANALMAPLHDRMPVILQKDDEDAWLDAALTDPARLLPLLAPYPAEAMEAYPVSRLVNSTRNDSPEVLQPM
jgi:putative SOS response-associated peptidase YedK